jgi:hypothetical protein
VVECEDREHARKRHAVADLVAVVPTAEVHGCACRRFVQALERGQLGRLLAGDRPADPVARNDLHRSGQRGDGQRHDERDALVPPAPAPQPRNGVDRGGQEAGDDVAGEVHVDGLGPDVLVSEQRLEWADIGDPAGLEREAARVVHPGVHRDHHQRAGEAGDHDRDTSQEMRPWRDAIPAVDVDGDEDRLDEERECLEREAESKDLTKRGHEVRPKQPELEAQDRAGDDPDREQGEHHFRPALRDRAVDRVAASEPQPFEHEHEGREGDAEADDRDVNGERERLHLPRLEQVLLVDGRERRGGEQERR